MEESWSKAGLSLKAELLGEKVRNERQEEIEREENDLEKRKAPAEQW